MLCFYLVNLGICPGLNYLDCLSGGFQMSWMLQLALFGLCRHSHIWETQMGQFLYSRLSGLTMHV